MQSVPLAITINIGFTQLQSELANCLIITIVLFCMTYTDTICFESSALNGIVNKYLKTSLRSIGNGDP
jgi:hypothetical protein